jgi:hypothetical protein
MVVTRKGFSQVVGNGFAGYGFAPEGPSVYEYPIEMFLAASDLSPLRENIDKVVYGLTKWQPKFNKKGIFYPGEAVTVQGKDYQEALNNMNSLFLKEMWSDGLPLLPATVERVDWLLTGTDLPPDQVVGKILARGGIATVRDIAVALAMAGGRPEYMPVLIAAVEAVADPVAGTTGFNATTRATVPVLIINGPIAKQVRLASGYGVMGPDPIHPAGASIGRAVRLILMNLGGAIPGIGTMAVYGGASRYANIVFAEDEASVPKGWDPLNVELGFRKGSNTVTLFIVDSEVMVRTMSGGPTAKEEETQYANTMAKVMGVPHHNYPWGGAGVPGIVLLSPFRASGVAEILGWTKQQYKDYLWENSKVPWSTIQAVWNPTTIPSAIAKNPALIKEGQPWPITKESKDIMVVMAGGAQSGQSFYMQTDCLRTPLTKEIKLPAAAKWDALIKQAETDLGPIPAQ